MRVRTLLFLLTLSTHAAGAEEDPPRQGCSLVTISAGTMASYHPDTGEWGPPYLYRSLSGFRPGLQGGAQLCFGSSAVRSLVAAELGTMKAISKTLTGRLVGEEQRKHRDTFLSLMTGVAAGAGTFEFKGGLALNLGDSDVAGSVALTLGADAVAPFPHVEVAFVGRYFHVFRGDKASSRNLSPHVVRVGMAVRLPLGRRGR
jgi:hypothetical protein